MSACNPLSSFSRYTVIEQALNTKRTLEGAMQGVLSHRFNTLNQLVHRRQLPIWPALNTAVPAELL
jgi:hypothetical protein